MAYDYDVDILAALWTGAEDAEEPYASFIADNPTLTNETSELRILSTIELLRSHMELIQSRDEANLLMYAISRLIRHTAGGSNPFSDSAAVTDVIGNIKQPVFPAGANVEITSGGVTTSATSATGGDCATVRDELNVVLDAPVAPTAEITSITAGADTDGSLGGSYFTINSAGDATNYYAWMSHGGRVELTSITAVADVGGALGGTFFTINGSGGETYYCWLDHTGLAEVTDVTAIADVGGSLGGTYFTLNSAADATAYYAWMSHPATSGFATAVNGALIGAFASAIGAATYDFDVTIDGGGLQTLSVVLAGGETYSAIAALMSPLVVGGTVTYDDSIFGFVVTSGTTGAASAATVAAGTAGSGGGDLFAALDAADTVVHSFPAPTAGLAAATDPAPGGTAIPIIYAVNDTAMTIGAALRSIIGALGDFGTAGAGALCTITNAASGDTTDAADVDTGFTVTVTTQGVDAAVDPAPGGLTSLTAAIAVGDTAVEVADAVRLVVDAAEGIEAEGSGNPVIVNTVSAATSDVADAADDSEFPTGFTITVTQQGVDSAVDPSPGGLTAIPVSYSVGDSPTEVALALSSDIGALGDFGASSEGATTTVTNAATGDTTDAADVETGFGISVTQQGGAGGGDSVPVTAFCTLDGRLGFRSQVDFTTFAVSDGTGGVLIPAGIPEGELLSTPAQVADTGRNLATNYVSKKPRNNPIS